MVVGVCTCVCQIFWQGISSVLSKVGLTVQQRSGSIPLALQVFAPRPLLSQVSIQPPGHGRTQTNWVVCVCERERDHEKARAQVPTVK